MRVLSFGARCGPPLTRGAIPAIIGLGVLALSSLHSSELSQTFPFPDLSRPADSAHQHLPVTIKPDPVVLGPVHPGKVAETWLSVGNMQAEPLTIERIESTCPCIEVEGLPVELHPNESKDLKVRFDASHDPHFEGQLSVQLTGYLTQGNIAFETKLKVAVGSEGRKGGNYQD